VCLSLSMPKPGITHLQLQTVPRLHTGMSTGTHRNGFNQEKKVVASVTDINFSYQRCRGIEVLQ
jgi:hypothetical protein